ncbi:Gag-like protein [Plakobranchus ocellatus]|uniref:Gag-like protein n=1 Tax=Plakobranchus ocellatus TaxID=259542 RepID=A0AAV4C0T0_9GAST|nr:Gag-like protein [Plakobranchus ocellatus]
MSRRGEEALHRGSSWGCLCCQQEEGGGPSYFEEHVDQLERWPTGHLLRSILKSIMVDETIEVTKLGSGDLMVELKSNDQAKRLGTIATFLDIPETVSPRTILNSLEKVFRSRDLRCCSEEEMVEELSGVTHARRIKVRRVKTKFRPTSSS